MKLWKYTKHWLGWRKHREPLARQLYQACVARARDPEIFHKAGISDTVDGRFDMIALYASLIIARLQKTDPALAQDFFDVMFEDIEHNLRVLGVSDLAVARKMRVHWNAFHGRLQRYVSCLRPRLNAEELQLALQDNLYRGQLPSKRGFQVLQRRIQKDHKWLASWTIHDILKGELSWGRA